MKRNRYWSMIGAGLIALGLYPTISQAEQILIDNEITARSAVVWRNGSFPVENFQRYTSAFGYRRSATGGYSREFHSGLDFAAPTGSYIRSWWSGRVSKVTSVGACGTSIWIQSGAWTHVYCHLKGYATASGGRRIVDNGSGLDLQEGQTIRAGDRIGRVGMTGRTTGPHLHWTLKYNGKFVDPAVVLRAMQGSGPVYSSQSTGTF
ncbi:MAG: M23 family metallopeptidase [Thermosynechococcaceae cyanobacterium]